MRSKWRCKMRRALWKTHGAVRSGRLFRIGSAMLPCSADARRFRKQSGVSRRGREEMMRERGRGEKRRWA